MEESKQAYAGKAMDEFERFYATFSKLLGTIGKERAHAEDGVLELAECAEYFLYTPDAEEDGSEAFDGYAQMEELRLLCLDIILNNMQHPGGRDGYVAHPFRARAAAYIAAHKLDGYAAATTARLYSAVLNMEFMRAMLPQFVEDAYAYCEKREQFVRYARISSLLRAYLRGAASHLGESLLYRDEPSGKRIFQIILDENFIGSAV